MLEVTDTAAERLRTALLKASGSRQTCFRVLVRENCLEVIPDEPRPDDVTLDHDDEALLVMDRETADRLSGHKLDYDEQVARLVFI
jgi:Fe-S cluster assembly iron-binding protein IscA